MYDESSKLQKSQKICSPPFRYPKLCSSNPPLFCGAVCHLVVNTDCDTFLNSHSRLQYNLEVSSSSSRMMKSHIQLVELDTLSFTALQNTFLPFPNFCAPPHAPWPLVSAEIGMLRPPNCAPVDWWLPEKKHGEGPVDNK